MHHLAVGCTGVFAITTSSHDGVVRFEPHRCAGRAHAALDDALRLARHGSSAVRERLRSRGFDVRVQPILCLPLSDLDRPQYVGGVIVTRQEHLDYLIRHWSGQPLTDAQATRVVAALQPRVHRAAA